MAADRATLRRWREDWPAPQQEQANRAAVALAWRTLLAKNHELRSQPSGVTPHRARASRTMKGRRRRDATVNPTRAGIMDHPPQHPSRPAGLGLPLVLSPDPGAI